MYYQILKDILQDFAPIRPVSLPCLGFYSAFLKVAENVVSQNSLLNQVPN